MSEDLERFKRRHPAWLDGWAAHLAGAGVGMNPHFESAAPVSGREWSEGWWAREDARSRGEETSQRDGHVDPLLLVTTETAAVRGRR